MMLCGAAVTLANYCACGSEGCSVFRVIQRTRGHIWNATCNKHLRLATEGSHATNTLLTSPVLSQSSTRHGGFSRNKHSPSISPPLLSQSKVFVAWCVSYQRCMCFVYVVWELNWVMCLIVREYHCCVPTSKRFEFKTNRKLNKPDHAALAWSVSCFQKVWKWKSERAPSCSTNTVYAHWAFSTHGRKAG